MVMECMATITGEHVGNPGFRDLGDFSQRRKILGSKNLHVFWRQIFHESCKIIVFFAISDNNNDLNCALKLDIVHSGN